MWSVHRFNGCLLPSLRGRPLSCRLRPRGCRPGAGNQAGEAYTRADYIPGQPRPAANPPAGSGNQPGVTRSIIFSVINIVAFGFGISSILGIIALVMTLTANSQLTGEALAARLRTAQTLNIIGIVLALFQLVVIISAIFFAVLGTALWGIIS
jgi:hypothetical protein